MDTPNEEDNTAYLVHDVTADNITYYYNNWTSLLNMPSSSLNSSMDDNVTMCTNAYCVSEDEYLDMIVDYVTPTLLECFLIAAYFLVFLVGLGGNFLVCFAVWRNYSMRTVTNYFIGE